MKIIVNPTSGRGIEITFDKELTGVIEIMADAINDLAEQQKRLADAAWKAMRDRGSHQTGTA